MILNLILFQFAIFDYSSPIGNDEKELASFSPSQPREKWQRKTTFIKIKVINNTTIIQYSIIVLHILFILTTGRILLQVIEPMM